MLTTPGEWGPTQAKIDALSIRCVTPAEYPAAVMDSRICVPNALTAPGGAAVRKVTRAITVGPKYRGDRLDRAFVTI